MKRKKAEITFSITIKNDAGDRDPRTARSQNFLGPRPVRGPLFFISWSGPLLKKDTSFCYIFKVSTTLI